MSAGPPHRQRYAWIGPCPEMVAEMSSRLELLFNDKVELENPHQYDWSLKTIPWTRCNTHNVTLIVEFGTLATANIHGVHLYGLKVSG